MKEIIAIDESNKELYSATIIRSLEKLDPEDLKLNEEELRSRFNVTVLDYELKQAFWREMALAQKQDRKMSDSNIFKGRCSSAYFYNKFMPDSSRLAWVMHPVSSYEEKIESILDSTVKRYNEILKMDITTQKKRFVEDSDGKVKREYYTDVDPKKALVLLAAIKNIEDRVKGATLQKQLQIRTTEPSKFEGLAEINMAAVDERIKELEARINPYHGDVEAEYEEK